MEPHSKICVIEQNVSITLVRCSGKFEALIRKLVTPLMTNGVSKVQTELDFQVPQKNKYRTTSEIKFVIEQSHPVKPVQDLGFLQPGM